jgi:hypothetical protein
MSEAERRGNNRRATRWTTDHAREVLARWRASGKSATAFAAEQGITATRLSYWAKQIEDVKAPEFVAVSVPESHVTPSRAAIEIEIEIEFGGLTLRVSESVDELYVARLIAALQARGCARC